jgi:predicted Zn-dependent protease with MMP-like domain
MMVRVPRRPGRETERRARSRFGRVVVAAIAELRTEFVTARDAGRLSASMAARFLEAMEQLPIFVADTPDRRQREENERPDELLGLYEGVPMTEWGADNALMPARITIFRLAIEDLSPSPDRQRDEIRKTVKHEIAHHLGWTDEQLHQAGLGDAED